MIQYLKGAFGEGWWKLHLGGGRTIIRPAVTSESPFPYVFWSRKSKWRAFWIRGPFGAFVQIGRLCFRWGSA